ncbi:Uncharacterised protein g5315 [Pycnogonum litorale]
MSNNFTTVLLVTTVVSIILQLTAAADQEISVCSLGKEVGRCRAAFKRYFYNAAEKKCLKFYYGGCGGNGNNFRRKKDCEDKCVKCS